MRCPACGARNADSADWCTLCYAPLRTEPPVAEPGPSPDTTAPTAPAATPADPARPDPVLPDAGAGTSPATSSDGRFRRTADGLDWRCPACDTWNPIERHTCVSCGAAFTQAFARDDDRGTAPDVTEPVAVGSSLLLPGLGHVLLGRTAAGALRMILYVTWLLGGLVLLRAAAGSGQPVLPAIPLLLGALVVLVASVIEVQRTVAGADTVLLTARITLWLVVAVLGALMLSFFAATMAVTP